MKCPFCNHDIPALWQNLHAVTNDQGRALAKPVPEIQARLPDTEKGDDVVRLSTTIRARWMTCSNEDCRRILIVIGQAWHHPATSPRDEDFRFWYGVPPAYTRPIDPVVPEPFAKDYKEAAAILNISPRMSATLSRSVLADLLKQFAGRKEYNLATRIDKFMEDKEHPERVKTNLHYLREIADFGAHTQTDQSTGAIIDVDVTEAEWTLDVIDGLFDYFIIGPARDEQRRKAWEKKMQKAGRKPLKKPKDG